MKNSIIKTILFLIVLFVPILTWGGIKLFSNETYEKLQFDTGEKREMSTISNEDNIMTDGTAISDFVADRAPFRSVIIYINKTVDQKLENVYQTGIKPLLTRIFFRQEASGASKDVSNDAYNDLFGKEDEKGTDSSTDSGNEKETSEHNYILVDEIESTCTKRGIRTYVCEDCNSSYSEEIGLKEHELILTNDVQADYEHYGHKDYYCVNCGYVESRDWVDKYIDDSYMAPSVVGSDVILGRFNWLFYAGLGTLDYYKGNNTMTEVEMEDYAMKLQTFNNLCKSKGIELAILIAPAKEQVYSEYMPTYTIENSYKRDAKLADYIKSVTDVSFSYPLTELQYAGRYWQDYSKYDTHWNRIGAYIGTMAVYSSLGKETVNPNSLAICVAESSNPGDLFALGGIDSSSYPEDTDYYIPYKDNVEVTYRNDNNYMNAPIYYSMSSCENNKKLFFVGDSYRTLMIPYLEKDYGTTVAFHKDVLSEGEPYLEGTTTIILMAAERNDMDILTEIETITGWLNK